MIDLPDYVRNIEENIIPMLKQQIELFESGKMRMYRLESGAPQCETTQEELARNKQHLETYEGIVREMKTTEAKYGQP